jgi:hypothetical protein
MHKAMYISKCVIFGCSRYIGCPAAAAATTALVVPQSLGATEKVPERGGGGRLIFIFLAEVLKNQKGEKSKL